jgi:phosphopantothenate synthetase
LHTLMKFLNGNPAMQEMFQDALNRLEKNERLAPVQRIVVNDVLTRANVHLAELQLEQEKKLKLQKAVPNTHEQNELQQAIDQLEEKLREVL